MLVISLLVFVTVVVISFFMFFFFNDTATTEIYTLSLHDALPIPGWSWATTTARTCRCMTISRRSEEHTSELQSRPHLVCRLLLEKKKKQLFVSQCIKKKKTKKTRRQKRKKN